MKSKYQHIFSPMTIRHMTVKNRIVMSLLTFVLYKRLSPMLHVRK